jgi:pimeloyl-ACP methyl ester carboxylesterase
MTEPEITRGFAVIGGVKMYYEVAGKGHPLVLAHAGIGDHRMWDDQFAVFAGHYTVIRYDMRGYGKTPPVDGVFSHYADLHGLLQHLGVERAHLLGCSLGAGAIIDFALEYPRMTASLVVVTGHPSGYPEPEDVFIPPQWEESLAAFEEGDFERTAELWVQMWVDGPHRTPGEVNPAIRDKVREMSLIALMNRASGLGSVQILEPPAAGRLDELHVPALFIIGELDDPDIVDAGHDVAGKIAGARKVVMNNVAHLPNMEQPAEFNRHVLEFLSSLTGHEQS